MMKYLPESPNSDKANFSVHPDAMELKSSVYDLFCFVF
jgi:hypothetical protein